VLERQGGDRLAVLLAAADASEGDDGADIAAPARIAAICGNLVPKDPIA